MLPNDKGASFYPPTYYEIEEFRSFKKPSIKGSSLKEMLDQAFPPTTSGGQDRGPYRTMISHVGSFIIIFPSRHLLLLNSRFLLNC